MISINTNLSSLITQSNLANSTLGLNQAIERMSTGFKINSAKDNAANHSIATNLTTKINAYQVAEENTLMGLDMINTASATLSEIEDRLSRLRALATQARNGTYGEDSKNAIQTEADSIVKEIERLYKTTEFNGINVFESNVTVADTGSRPIAGADGFIQTVTKVDTSTLTTLASVDENVALTSGTYSISTADELVKLADMTNNGLIGTDTEFVLTNDIDLSHIDNWTPIGNQDYIEGALTGYFFNGDFNGNGYVISNLKINSNKYYVGLFGRTTSSVTIKNLGIENVDIFTSLEQAGAFVGQAYGTTLENCYSTGIVRTNNTAAGGLCGQLQGAMNNCYSKADVYSINNTGGLVGVLLGNVTNSYYEGEIYSQNLVRAGGIAGLVYDGNRIIDNCYVNITGKNTGAIFVGRCNDLVSSLTITNSSYSALDNSMPYVALNNSPNPVAYTNISEIPVIEASPMTFQVGTNSEASSQIGLNLSLNVGGTYLLRNLFYKDSFSEYYFDFFEDYMTNIITKQTEYGAIQNRLESALEEISIQYENLVSSRSTIKDADIAEESSEYIKHQILQQASATLLATANQTPAIALQLI